MSGSYFGSAGAAAGLSARRRAGFTLLEVLLVVVISLIAAGIAVPTLMRTLRGERLRAAARAVATSHRFARATAALRAEEVELRLEPAARRVRVLRRPATPPPVAESAEPAPTDPSETKTAASGVAIEAFREWAGNVRLRRIEVEEEVFEDGEARSIRYAPGGRCPAYGVFFEDERGDRATVRVDSITGKARVDYERANR